MGAWLTEQAFNIDSSYIHLKTVLICYTEKTIRIKR